MNFIQTYKIENEVCDDLIDYYNNSVEYKTEGTIDSDRVDKKIKDSMDVYFLNCSSDFRIKNLFSAMNPCILDYVKRYDISFAVKTDVVNHIQYYKPKGGYRKLHSERSPKSSQRVVVYMLYLNDVDNGGTYFPFQNTTIQAVKGDLILWPADFTHPHRGVISDTQEKYICTGWYNYLL